MTEQNKPTTSANNGDKNTTLAELREIVREFVAERDWQQFHSPKNLSMSLTIEAGELMEHFQWLTNEESNQVACDPEAVAAAGEEIADVLCYLLGLANQLNLDLAGAFRDKMAKNRLKYPAEQFRGRYR
ncbi:MAG: nucleotide pyrophosphohydrolase [Planctomycetales bacterium]|nr:nucleotide pyrophosphohydrolase [Planctomycetales bacterium]